MLIMFKDSDVSGLPLDAGSVLYQLLTAPDKVNMENLSESAFQVCRVNFIVSNIYRSFGTTTVRAVFYLARFKMLAWCAVEAGAGGCEQWQHDEGRRGHPSTFRPRDERHYRSHGCSLQVRHPLPSPNRSAHVTSLLLLLVFWAGLAALSFVSVRSRKIQVRQQKTVFRW